MLRPLGLQQLCDDVLRLLDASDRGFLPHAKLLWHFLCPSTWALVPGSGTKAKLGAWILTVSIWVAMATWRRHKKSEK